MIYINVKQFRDITNIRRIDISFGYNLIKKLILYLNI